VYLHYYLRYNYMFRLSNNNHLQVVHESLGNSYANIKVPNTSPAYKHTQTKLPTVKIKDEISYQPHPPTPHFTQPILISCVTVS